MIQCIMSDGSKRVGLQHEARKGWDEQMNKKKTEIPVVVVRKFLFDALSDAKNFEFPLFPLCVMLRSDDWVENFSEVIS